ncbi:ferrodoxin [Moraxella macacae 0408225]|uniref:Ferrodoxin n=1 Tax=Moraxella macacae 0408225 TaxID=1230338 RepID=L2F567_9GAMM|nr:2Fe-2S iron-sulfur cluster-binding protein [Moraxella macacae]ELA08184.1 ferrodoxin [Moraxella macacae 0408225]
MAWIIHPNTHFYLHDNETLLAGLRRVGVAVDFECQQGYCGVCKQKFVKLNSESCVQYTLTPLVMLTEDELLPCCCQIKGAIKLLDPNNQ